MDGKETTELEQIKKIFRNKNNIECFHKNVKEIEAIENSAKKF